MGVWNYFVLTLLLELPIVLLFFKGEWKFALLIGFLLNLFTWPLLHILLFYTGININILEIGVAITESIGYYLLMQCNWKKAITLGFTANAVSYGLGLLLNNFI
jgi:hypothetical protein